MPPLENNSPVSSEGLPYAGAHVIDVTENFTKKFSDMKPSPYFGDSSFCKIAMRRAKALHLFQKSAEVYQGADDSIRWPEYFHCLTAHTPNRLYVAHACVISSKENWSAERWTKECFMVRPPPENTWPY
jgi:hypothetical protein